jgi:hypothetical protein
MKDPVSVFGRVDVIPPFRQVTCIHLPDTNFYIHEILPKSSDERMIAAVNFMQTYHLIDETSFKWEWQNTVMSSMVVERAYLLDLIQRYMNRYGNSSILQDIIVYIEAWKKELVLDPIRRQWAARRVQKQFRESMSNPSYRLCKRRLLRELSEGI